MEITLKKPIKKDDNTISLIKLDLDSLTGNDLIKVEKEARQRGDTSPNPLFSSEGLCIVAARSCGLIPEDIMGLSAPDFLQVTNTVSNFLYGWVLPTNLQSEIYEQQS